MPYLESIPLDSKEYGINKMLTVRSLSIDWKHRDTEIHLRSPQMLEYLESIGYSYKEIIRNRSTQLRFIHHISRNIYKAEDPNSLLCFFNQLNKSKLLSFPGNTFLDFEYIHNNPRVSKDLIRKSVVFSFKFKQIDMIKYFMKYFTPADMPLSILMSLEPKIFYEYLTSNLSLIITDENTFSEDQLQFMWSSNYHIYFYNNYNHFDRLTYKSDSSLPSPQKIIG